MSKIKIIKDDGKEVDIESTGFVLSYVNGDEKSVGSVIDYDLSTRELWYLTQSIKESLEDIYKKSPMLKIIDKLSESRRFYSTSEPVAGDIDLSQIFGDNNDDDKNDDEDDVDMKDFNFEAFAIDLSDGSVEDITDSLRSSPKMQSSKGEAQLDITSETVSQLMDYFRSKKNDDEG